MSDTRDYFAMPKWAVTQTPAPAVPDGYSAIDIPGNGEVFGTRQKLVLEPLVFEDHTSDKPKRKYTKKPK